MTGKRKQVKIRAEEHTRRYNTKYQGSEMDVSLLSMTHRKGTRGEDKGRKGD